MDELTREFLIESQEGLDRMERCLTELEERPHDAALLADIFRSVHTIKGTTGFLGFKRLEKLAHSGENLLGLLREGKLAAEQAIITTLLELLDGLRSILRTIESNGDEGTEQDTDLIARLETLVSGATVAPPPVPTKKQAAEKPSVPTPNSGLTAPDGTRARKETCTIPALTSTPQSSATGAPAELAAIPAMHATTLPAMQATEIPATQTIVDFVAASASIPANAPSTTSDGSSDARPKTLLNSAAESSLRVDVTLLNRMMNLVGELVLTRNQVLQATSADPNMTVLSRRLDMVTADLRESVMKARMQPVTNIFSKMPRIVRDLAQTLHKKVRIQMEGQETELDKSLLEAIKDPLTHAVRNSLDHGFELPALRETLGKDPEGTLKLKASQEGSHVLIEISDDGAGIAIEKVRDKAIERGLTTVERAAQMTDRELLQMIFLPGFSTADKITNVSGRGVGMDVVRTNVEKIGGKVELDSRPGKGTTMRMRIPLTMAIIPALIVRSVNQSFALPQGALSELVHVPQDQVHTLIEWIENAPLYRLRGKLLPLVYLDRLLKQSNRQADALGRESFIAVLNADGRQFGLVVDGLADPEEIVVKPLSAVLKGIGLYSGATVLGNGDLALILDPGSIASKAGVTLREEETAHVTDSQDSIDQITGMKYLLVETADRQAAVPLADVLRIEQIPLSRVEYIGYQPVLNFEGQLLPIEDTSGLLTAAQDNPDAQIVVVVCREGNRHVGIAVSHVLDVTAGGDLFEAGTNQQTQGITLLKNRVTGVVNLGGVPALPVIPTSGWEQLAERTQ